MYEMAPLFLSIMGTPSCGKSYFLASMTWQLRQTFPRFREHEPQLRAALQVSLADMALERAGKLTEEPYRRGHRIDILSHATLPLRPQLGKRGFDRLVRALSVVYGIEAYVILRDIWGARDREIQAVARWIASALVDAALRDAERPQKPARRTRQRKKNGTGLNGAQR